MPGLPAAPRHDIRTAHAGLNASNRFDPETVEDGLCSRFDAFTGLDARRISGRVRRAGDRDTARLDEPGPTRPQGLPMRPFSIICSVIFAATLAVTAPVHAGNGKQGTTTVQRQPAKAKTPPWHLGWLIAKLKSDNPGKPKPSVCKS